MSRHRHVPALETKGMLFKASHGFKQHFLLLVLTVKVEDTSGPVLSIPVMLDPVLKSSGVLLDTKHSPGFHLKFSRWSH